MLLHTILDPLAVMEQQPPPAGSWGQLSPFTFRQWEGEGKNRRLSRIISTDLSQYLPPHGVPHGGPTAGW